MTNTNPNTKARTELKPRLKHVYQRILDHDATQSITVN